MHRRMFLYILTSLLSLLSGPVPDEGVDKAS